jgi:hypothetical protein
MLITDIQRIDLNFPRYWSANIAPNIGQRLMNPAKTWKMVVEELSLKFNSLFK